MTTPSRTPLTSSGLTTSGLTSTGLSSTTFLPTINSLPSSRQRIADRARPSSRRDGPSELKGTASRARRAPLLAALGGPHAVGLLLLLRVAAAVYRVPGGRERVADLVCAGARGDAAC